MCILDRGHSVYLYKTNSFSTESYRRIDLYEMIVAIGWTTRENIFWHCVTSLRGCRYRRAYCMLISVEYRVTNAGDYVQKVIFIFFIMRICCSANRGSTKGKRIIRMKTTKSSGVGTINWERKALFLNSKLNKIITIL